MNEEIDEREKWTLHLSGQLNSLCNFVPLLLQEMYGTNFV